MYEIKNLLFQPLTLHRLDGTGLHLGPRERQTLPDTAVSPDMRQAARRGQVNLHLVVSAVASSGETTPAAQISASAAPSTRKGGK